jgi:hypothetical protein
MYNILKIATEDGHCFTYSYAILVLQNNMKIFQKNSTCDKYFYTKVRDIT